MLVSIDVQSCSPDCCHKPTLELSTRVMLSLQDILVNCVDCSNGMSVQGCWNRVGLGGL